MKKINDVKKIVADVFKITSDEVNQALTPELVKEWDSLGQLNLIQAIEAEFDIEFEIDEIFSIYTIGDLFELLRNRKLIDES